MVEAAHGDGQTPVQGTPVMMMMMILGPFRGRIDILSTLQKFAAVCLNSVGNLKCPSENCNCNFLLCLIFATHNIAILLHD